MKMALVLALLASPALADNSLPPAKYDVGGATEVEVLLNYYAFNVGGTIERVPIGEALAACERVSLDRTGLSYPAAALLGPGKRLVGCTVNDALVYSYDPARPEYTAQILRHEIGHLLGWPADHRRD